MVRKKKRHQLDPFFRRDPNGEWELVSRLVPEKGLQAETLQGTLLLANLRLWKEMASSGGANWDDNVIMYDAYCEILIHHLCDGTFDAKKERFVRHTIYSVKRWMSGEVKEGNWIVRALSDLQTLICNWCLLHPDPIKWSFDGGITESRGWRG
jgi:hypothetical protein